MADRLTAEPAPATPRFPPGANVSSNPDAPGPPWDDAPAATDTAALRDPTVTGEPYQGPPSVADKPIGMRQPPTAPTDTAALREAIRERLDRYWEKGTPDWAVDEILSGPPAALLAERDQARETAVRFIEARAQAIAERDQAVTQVAAVRALAAEYERLPGDMSVFVADAARLIRHALRDALGDPAVTAEPTPAATDNAALREAIAGGLRLALIAEDATYEEIADELLALPEVAALIAEHGPNRCVSVDDANRVLAEERRSIAAIIAERAERAPDTTALRQAIGRALSRRIGGGIGWHAADAVLALPEVAALIAERDQAVAQVAAVEALCSTVETAEDESTTAERRLVRRIRRALGDQP